MRYVTLKRFLLCVLLFGSVPVLPVQQGWGQTSNQQNSRLRVAQDLERRRLFDRALRIYLRLYQEVPGNHVYYEGVKRNMLRLEKFAELGAIIEEQIRRTQDPRFFADLGHVRYRSGQHQEALQIWAELLEKFPKNKVVYSYVANAMIGNRLYDEAIDVYLRARKKFKSKELFVFELANLYAIRLNYRAATEEYLNYLERHPNQFGYIESRIASYTKEKEQAHKVAELLRARLEKTRQPYLVRKLLANLYLRVEEYGRALQQFKILEAVENPAARSRATGQELYFFADKALRAGGYDYAREAYRLILSNYPNSPFRWRALYGLALASQKQGQAHEAIQAYSDLIETAPRSPQAYDAQFQIAEIYFSDLFQLDKALDAYQTLLARYPGGRKTIEVYFRIGDCYTARGDLETALNWYEKPLGGSGLDPVVRDRALYKAAYVDFIRGDYERAVERLQQITANLDEKPGGSQQYVNDAFELIMLIEDNRRDSEEALTRFARAQQLKLQRNYADAAEQLLAILKEFPEAAIVDESLLELGEISRLQGNYGQAVGYFSELLQSHPQSVYADLAQKRIGEVYEEGLGDYQKAYHAYEQVLINYPSSLYLEEVRQRMRRLQSRNLVN